jgi:hypothetical protein
VAKLKALTIFYYAVKYSLELEINNTIMTLPYSLDVEVLLYRKENLPKSENNVIFYSVQLVDSKRF